MMRRTLTMVVAVGMASKVLAGGAPVPAGAGKFIEANCLECHDDQVKKGNLDLSSLAFDLGDQKTFDVWVKVHDRVRDGEMPPKKKDGAKVEAGAGAGFLKEIGEPMGAADRARALAEGRAVWRRLNRYEYENAVRDLLGAPWLAVKEMLPEDAESHRFNKAGEALAISHVHMASYLNAAESALRQVMVSSLDKPQATVHKYYARQQRAFNAKLRFSQFNRSPDRAVYPMIGTKAQPELLEGTLPVTVGEKDPKTRELEAYGVTASSYEPIELRFDQFTAPVGGRYKLRFSTYTFWAGPSEGAKWWVPDRSKTFPGRRDEPVTIYSETVPRILRWLGTFDAKVEPGVSEVDTYLLPGETIRPDAARLYRSRPPAFHNPLAEKDGAPGVAFRWMEVEGPIYEQWPPAGHALMFGDLPVHKTADGIEVESKDPERDAERLLRRFMERAYRRPVPSVEVDRFLTVIHGAMKAGATFTDAMISGYSAVLCSPGFVCLEERPGKLDDHAVASRLSFFLTNSAPDEALRELAAKGELKKAEVIRKQADRLLGDKEKSGRFVDAFLDYWLDLRKIQATSPDASLYPDYYLDDLLTESSTLETQLFFKELLAKNLPTSNIASSDFTFLNERLAKHYGIDGVKGVAMRRVSLPPGSVRGGLMTMASVLKVTANGTTTSPVLRGAWIMERVLGKPPPPPPPSVPAVEPDIRGATTIRQQLEKHRTLATCASCHAKIDPAGFALESFDVMGGFRDHYRAMGEGGKPPEGIGHNGQKFAFHLGQPVDASGVLPDGRKFADVRELKKLLVSDQRQLARNLVQQLVTYGTGAPVRFGDRAEVERILDRAAEKKYGVRTIVEEVVGSEMFLRK